MIPVFALAATKPSSGRKGALVPVMFVVQGRRMPTVDDARVSIVMLFLLVVSCLSLSNLKRFLTIHNRYNLNFQHFFLFCSLIFSN